MSETVRDYFKELQLEKIEISRSKSRKANYQILAQQYEVFRIRRRSKPAQRTTIIIEEAMDIFRDENKYRAYLRELDASTARPEPEPDSRPFDDVSCSSSEPKSWKELLFGAAVEITKAAAKAYVETKHAERQHGEEEYHPSLEHPRRVVLNGIWIAGDGLPIRFNQRGNQLAFTGVNQFGMTVVQGNGIVEGDRAQLHFQYYDGVVYDQATATMQISGDGQRMEGMVVYKMTGVRRMMGLVKQH